MDKGRDILHKDFIRLFNRRERKTLLGKNSVNLWILSGILFVTFLAIGFANGSLEYLANKMKDPFVNWVDIKVFFRDAADIEEIRSSLNKPEILETYQIANVTGYYRFSLLFYDTVEKGSYKAMGRTINVRNPVLEEILANENLISGRGFQSASDIGLIVTENLLEESNYPTGTPWLLMNIGVGGASGDEERNIPVPVIAVVKSLPGLAQFITTPYFYANRMMTYTQSPFNPLDERKLIVYVDEGQEAANELGWALFSTINKHPDFSKYDPNFTVTRNSKFNSGHNIVIDFYPEPPDIYTIDSIFSLVRNIPKAAAANGFTRIYDYGTKLFEPRQYKRWDHLAINFSDLGKIRAFSEYMLEQYEIEIELAQIISKENYLFITKLTRIISLILIGFSILSICLFLSNLLRNHLNSIRMNIGTFKAFGLENKILQSIYLKMIIGVIILSFLVSLIAGWFFGAAGGMRLVLLLFGNPLESGESYYQLFDYWTIISIVLILSVSFLVLYFTARKILKKTPGDLIYDR
jgi:hypothetical protein